MLHARFAMPLDYLRRIVAIEEERAGLPFGVTLREAVADSSAAVGPSQGVMFVIGAVANHGEDTLREVFAG